MKLTRNKGMALALCSLPVFFSGLTGCQSNSDSPVASESGNASDIDAVMQKAETPNPESSVRPSMTATAPASIPSATDMSRFLEGNRIQAAPIPNPAPIAPQTNALSKTAAFGCTIAFDSRTSLSNLPDHASWGFAPYYIENCGNSSYGQVYPTVDGHFHLAYENPDFAPAGGGKLGVYLGHVTQNPPPNCEYNIPSMVTTGYDAANYHRYMMAHDDHEWMKINVMSSNGIRKVFDLKSLYIRPNASPACEPNGGKIQLWIKKYSTQQWYYWATLLPGYYWSPYPADGADLDEIQITSPSGSLHWQVDDIAVNVH